MKKRASMSKRVISRMLVVVYVSCLIAGTFTSCGNQTGKAKEDAEMSSNNNYNSNDNNNDNENYSDADSTGDNIINPVYEKYIEYPLKVDGHPRLYFTKEDIPALTAKASDTNPTVFGNTGEGIWSKIKSLAQGYLTEESFTVPVVGGGSVTYPLPPKQPESMDPPPNYTGDSRYPYWTGMTECVKVRMEVLSIAYLITHEQAYAERAKEYALSVAGWDVWSDPTYPTYGSQYHSSLDTTHLTFGVCAVYDILYDYLTEKEREALKDALENKGLANLYKDCRVFIDHNIYAAIAAALAVGALSTLGENPDANKYLTTSISYFKWYMDRRMASGQNEGLDYTSFCYESIIKAIDQIVRVTGDEKLVRELIEHPFLNDFAVRWVLYSLAPGGGSSAPISDSTSTNVFYVTMHVANNWLKNGYAGWYLSAAKPQPGSYLDMFVYFNPDIKITHPEESLPSSTVLEEIGWAALRSGWDSEDIALLFISNNHNSIAHNHHDQNSFLIAANNTWLASDPGYQEYSAGPGAKYTNSIGHNTILVDGNGQSAFGSGSMEKWLLAPSYDYVKGSAAESYGEFPRMERFDRHIVFIKPHYYVILDDLKADAARNFEWVLYSGRYDRNITKYEINGKPVGGKLGESSYGDEILISKGTANMTVKFLAKELLPVFVGFYPGAESYGPYVKVGSGKPSKEYRFLTVIKPEPASRYVIKAKVDAELVQNAGAIGARIYRDESKLITDLVLFKDSGKENFSLEKVKSDGSQVVVSYGDSGAVAGYSMIDGKFIEFDGRMLVKSIGVFSSSFECDYQAGVIEGVVDVEELTTIQLLTGFKPGVTMDGIQFSGNYSYDEAAGLLTLSIPEGVHSIKISR